MGVVWVVVVMAAASSVRCSDGHFILQHQAPGMGRGAVPCRACGVEPALRYTRLAHPSPGTRLEARTVELRTRRDSTRRPALALKALPGVLGMALAAGS